jgi:hypothetical protein
MAFEGGQAFARLPRNQRHERDEDRRAGGDPTIIAGRFSTAAR